MKLIRQEVNGEVIFRNSETNEIVKKEPINSIKNSETVTPSHTSILGSIITFIGVLILLFSIYLIVAGLNSPILGFATLPLGSGLFVSAVILFAVAELVHNSQYQTKLLKKLLEK